MPGQQLARLIDEACGISSPGFELHDLRHAGIAPVDHRLPSDALERMRGARSLRRPPRGLAQ
jgi:hypothetical protein